MTMIPPLREQVRQMEIDARTIADWLERYAAGLPVDDPLPSAARDMWAAVRCLQEARANLERVKL